MTDHQGSFSITGKFPTLETKIAPGYLNLSRGVWAIAIQNVTIHWRRNRNETVNSVVGLYCNAVRGTYFSERGQDTSSSVPLAVFNLVLNTTGSYFYEPVRTWHTLNFYAIEKVKFTLRCQATQCPIELVQEDITVFFTLKKLT